MHGRQLVAWRGSGPGSRGLSPAPPLAPRPVPDRPAARQGSALSPGRGRHPRCQHGEPRLGSQCPARH